MTLHDLLFDARRRRLFRRFSPGNGGEGNGIAGRIVGYLISAVLIAALILVGLHVLPLGARGGDVAHFVAPPGQLYMSQAGTIPVFVMRPDREVVRHGVARPVAGGLLRVEFYETPLPAFERTSEALLVEPGLSVLWVTATPANRKRLRQRIERLQDQVGLTIERVARSDAFARTYKPRLRDILSEAVIRAWREPRSQAVVDRLMKRGVPALRETMAGEAGDVLREHLGDAVWDMLKANWRRAFGVVLGGKLDYSPVNAALVEAWRDPRLRSAVRDLGTRLLALPESRQLSERLAVSLADTLVRDARLAQVIADMTADQRLIDEVRPLSQAFYDLAGAVPANLAGLGGENDVSPLAAHVFKSLGLDSRIDLILFVTSAHEARFAEEAADAYRSLRRVHPRKAPQS